MDHQTELLFVQGLPVVKGLRYQKNIIQYLLCDIPYRTCTSKCPVLCKASPGFPDICRNMHKMCLILCLSWCCRICIRLWVFWAIVRLFHRLLFGLLLQQYWGNRRYFQHPYRCFGRVVRTWEDWRWALVPISLSLWNRRWRSIAAESTVDIQLYDKGEDSDTN